MLLPWRKGPAPEGVLAPDADNGTGLLDAEQLAQATAGRQVVLVPCTFETLVEELAAPPILQQLSAREHLCILMAQLLPPHLHPGEEVNDLIMQRHDSMLAMGVDGVLINPDPDPQALKHNIHLSYLTWELNVRRMQLMVQAEPDLVDPEQVRQLENQQQRLLWESIPRTLMPHFASMNPRLVETGNRVDKYCFTGRFESNEAQVLQAMDENKQLFAIKVIDKSKIFMPGELEGIYREYRFLSDIVKHVHVVRCLQMLHSPSRLYLVFEVAGDLNLAQMLSLQPGWRLDEEESLDYFVQICRALAHCHSLHIAHRNVALEHVVLAKLAGSNKHHCRLLDFRCAIVSQGLTSRTCCGGLPCIAPEMALGGPYVPALADCWSAGIVLLEMSGGLSSLSRTVPYNPAHADVQQVAVKTQQLFSDSAGHARALGAVGAVESPAILNRLQFLLQPEPTSRARIKDMPGLP